MNPQDLLYRETHEWVRVQDEDGGKVATIGITEFAAQELTDLVFLEFHKRPGEELSAGEEFGEVESVKAVSSLYSPVTGKITGVNEQLPDQLEWISDDPFDKGWMIKVQITDESSLSELMDHATYTKQCQEEA